jgi:hypothetical protein
MARAVICEVLSEKIDNGYWLEKEAIEFATRILKKNPMKFYNRSGSNSE